MPNNLGLQYKSGLGSALRVGTISFLFQGGDSAYTAKTFYQTWTPRISGMSKTILENEPFIWTYRILPEAVTNPDEVTNAPTIVYRGDTGNNKLHMVFNFQNGKYTFFYISVNETPSNGIFLVYNNTVPNNQISRNRVYNFTLYKNEGPFTAASSYRYYINGQLKTLTPLTTGGIIGGSLGAAIPSNQLSGITFNDVYFGGTFGTGPAGGPNRTVPMYVFNNSVFKLDSGLTTTYIDNLVTELHRVDNYIHLLPTSYSINPSNVAYYFPLYLKEGRDIRDYYNPSKKFYTEIGLGNSRTGDFVSTGTTNYLGGQPTQSASVYKGPYNIWKKPYPPYEPYI